MQLVSQNKRESDRRVLGRLTGKDYVDRQTELDKVVSVALGREFSNGALIAAQPGAGASEFLRQAFDVIFALRSEVVPLYFCFSQKDTSPATTAQHFVGAVLTQFLAWRRGEPALCRAVLSSREIADLAPPSDVEWIERALAVCNSNVRDEELNSHVRNCFGVIRRMREAGCQPFLLADRIDVGDKLFSEFSIVNELAKAVASAECRYVFSGLRRDIVNLFPDYSEFQNASILIKLEEMSAADAPKLVEQTSRRFGVSVHEQTRDLISQQFGSSPFLVASYFHAAAEKGIALTTFRDCQQLYLDELMGGRLFRHFNQIIEGIVPSPVVRRNLTKVLYESRLVNRGRIGIDAFCKRLEIEYERAVLILEHLNSRELVSLSSNFVQVNSEMLPWLDYLGLRYRLEVVGEPRALVFADSLLEILKRAPRTMARHYRREASLGLKETLQKFNCQRLPQSLFHYDVFKRDYRGLEEEKLVSGLDNETELIRLPQIVHAANSSAFDAEILRYCDEERCIVGHGFEAGSYSEANETVWIAMEIESKLEAGRGLVEVWYERLERTARTCGFERVKFWFVAPEGFSDEAILLLNELGVYNSSRQQYELITARLGMRTFGVPESVDVDEFEMIIPMGEDSELIAANTVEQIARRVNFSAAAINQIKTALVEACINASEHSLSPDRKIYQQFRVESDKLVVIVSSRGVIPFTPNGQSVFNGNEESGGIKDADSSPGRRGWGLKLIETLMDEVEFEAVDDGTRLRMTKYLKRN